MISLLECHGTLLEVIHSGSGELCHISEFIGNTSCNCNGECSPQISNVKKFHCTP